MSKLLTAAEKGAIRNSRCGRCSKRPPFKDGSRCHPHRIVPGCRGGKYTKKNTVPRCPSCHDIEHGGTGEAPFIGAASAAGRKGGFARRPRSPREAEISRNNLRKADPSLAGKIGGRRTHELHPELASNCGKKTQERHPEVYSAIGKKYGVANFRRFGLSAAGKLGGAVSAHRRYHEPVGKFDPSCALCAQQMERVG